MKRMRIVTVAAALVVMLCLGVTLAGCGTTNTASAGGSGPIEVGNSYFMTWGPSGGNVKVLDIRSDGWIKIQSSAFPGEGWLNITSIHVVREPRSDRPLQ